MDVSNFKAGNIILEVVFVDSSKLTREQIERLYQLSDAEKTVQLLKSAQKRGLSAVEVHPSYGAECTVLFRTAEILPGHVLHYLPCRPR